MCPEEMMFFAYLHVVKGLTVWIEPREEQEWKVQGSGEFLDGGRCEGRKCSPLVSHINDLQSVYHEGDTGQLQVWDLLSHLCL